MDGNGRWAEQRGLPRTKGHLEGLKAAKRVVGRLADLSVEYVTLYTFSTENWRRPPKEVSFLMGLVSKHLLRELPFYREHDIRVRHIGSDDHLPPPVLEHIYAAEEQTRHHRGLQVILAVNYGGRDEITRGINRLLQQCREHAVPEGITCEDFSCFLDTSDIPDPELILRSAGEKRLSNFYIWQGAYAEYCFHDAFWPDWDEQIIDRCLLEYQRRNRKFGGIEGE